MNPDDVQRLGDGSWMFTFGVRDGDLPRLPLGSTFEVIYSPSHMGTMPQGWRWYRFEVAYKMNPIRKEYERTYVAIERRALEEGEIALMEAFII